MLSKCLCQRQRSQKAFMLNPWLFLILQRSPSGVLLALEQINVEVDFKAEGVISLLSPGPTRELLLCSCLRENRGITAWLLLVLIHLDRRTKKLEINKSIEINLVQYQGRLMLSFS